MSKEIEDDVFGKLTKNFMGDWSVDFYFELFQEKLTLSIEADEDEERDKPTKKQYDSFVWLKDEAKLLKMLLEEAVFNHYSSNIKEIRSAWGIEADDNAPILQSAREVWPLLSSPNISLLSEYADICITLQTTWDPEHGVTVLFENGSVKRVE